MAKANRGEASRQEKQAAAKPKKRLRRKPLPPYKVLLHNDDINPMDHVVFAIMELTRLPQTVAVEKMLEAHMTGLSLLLVTHKERAELLVEQFMSKKLTVTIEPA